MKKAICFILFLVSIFAFSGCGMVSEQPDKEELEQYLHENSDDFNTVLNYLIGQNGIVYFDYDGVEFENWFDSDVPTDVIKAIKRLKRDDRIVVSKDGNTIFFGLWMPLMSEKSRGLAYSINGVDEPEVGYTIEMTPISEPGWYYYVDDFHAWRSEHRDTATETTNGSLS